MLIMDRMNEIDGIDSQIEDLKNRKIQLKKKLKNYILNTIHVLVDNGIRCFIGAEAYDLKDIYHEVVSRCHTVRVGKLNDIKVRIKFIYNYKDCDDETYCTKGLPSIIFDDPKELEKYVVECKEEQNKMDAKEMEKEKELARILEEERQEQEEFQKWKLERRSQKGDLG